MRRLLNEPDSRLEINLVPLIDVLFALLTFFILSTLFLNRTQGLPVNLPKATTATPQKTEKATVTVDPQGNLFLNRQPIQVERLADSIRQLTKPNQDLVVVLNADGMTTHNHVIAVMDQLRQVPRTKLAIATKQP